MNKLRNTMGWTIALAALGLNFIVGILYSWSVLKKALVEDWGWSNTEASLPYTVCVATLAFMTIFAGRAQDKYGPRNVALLGGLLFGAGLIISSWAKNPTIMVLSYGLLGGMGIGFVYAAGTPCAIKWFEPSKKGLIAGIVVSGVGLSPVYIAPLTNSLLNTHSVEQTFIYLGIITLITCTVFSMVLRNPPVDFIPGMTTKSAKSTSGKSEISQNPTATTKDYTWKETIKTKPFIMLWLSYLMSAAAGLMLIGHMASIASDQAGWKAGFMLVVILAVFNALGRLLGGVLSDKTGRTKALLIVFLIQAVNMFLFSFYGTIPTLIIGSAIAGLAYGALFSLFPAATADFFGLKNLGVNYGMVFSGWGVAGIIGPILGGLAQDLTGTYSISYVISGIMLLIGALLVIQAKSPQSS